MADSALPIFEKDAIPISSAISNFYQDTFMGKFYDLGKINFIT